MQSGDGWLLRLKPRLCRISAADGKLIARQSWQCGNGIIELTGRGNLQVRGLTPASAERFARFAVAVGLASADPAVERRRNVLLSPLAGEAACAVARALEEQLADDCALDDLPGKFGFAVDDGGGRVRADVTLRAAGGAWRVNLGRDDFACERGREAALAVGLARTWLALGESARPSRDAAAASNPPPPVGWQPEARAFGVGLPFGETDAATLDRLCGLAQRFGDGVLHLTPWRVILLSGVSARNVAALEASAGGIVSPHDLRLLASACIGSRGCLAGSVDARADALALLAAGVNGAFLHVSGCAKGCAHPEPAAITLVGKDGQYGLVRDGRAGDTPHSDSLTLGPLARLLSACDARERLGRS